MASLPQTKTCAPALSVRTGKTNSGVNIGPISSHSGPSTSKAAFSSTSSYAGLSSRTNSTATNKPKSLVRPTQMEVEQDLAYIRREGICEKIEVMVRHLLQKMPQEPIEALCLLLQQRLRVSEPLAPRQALVTSLPPISGAISAEGPISAVLPPTLPTWTSSSGGTITTTCASTGRRIYSANRQRPAVPPSNHGNGVPQHAVDSPVPDVPVAFPPSTEKSGDQGTLCPLPLSSTLNEEMTTQHPSNSSFPDPQQVVLEILPTETAAKLQERISGHPLQRHGMATPAPPASESLTYAGISSVTATPLPASMSSSSPFLFHGGNTLRSSVPHSAGAATPLRHSPSAGCGRVKSGDAVLHPSIGSTSSSRVAAPSPGSSLSSGLAASRRHSTSRAPREGSAALSVTDRDESLSSENSSCFSALSVDMSEFLQEFRQAHMAYCGPHKERITREELYAVVEAVSLPMADMSLIADLFEEMTETPPAADAMDTTPNLATSTAAAAGSRGPSFAEESALAAPVPEEALTVRFEALLARMNYKILGRYPLDMVRGAFYAMLPREAALQAMAHDTCSKGFGQGVPVTLADELGKGPRIGGHLQEDATLGEALAVIMWG